MHFTPLASPLRDALLARALDHGITLDDFTRAPCSAEPFLPPLGPGPNMSYDGDPILVPDEQRTAREWALYATVTFESRVIALLIMTDDAYIAVEPVENAAVRDLDLQARWMSKYNIKTLHITESEIAADPTGKADVVLETALEWDREVAAEGVR